MATLLCLKTLNFPGIFIVVCFELKKKKVPEEQKQTRSKTVKVRLNCLPEFSIDFGNKLLKIVKPCHLAIAAFAVVIIIIVTSLDA